MFERFTQDARAVVTNAVGEAERRRDRHVGTEHMLLGVIASTSPVTSAALGVFGIDLPSARATLEAGDAQALAAVGIDVAGLAAPADTPQRPPRRFLWSGEHKPFTGGAKRTLEAALREAVRLGDRHISTEHMLLALAAKTAPDRAHQLLTAMSVDPRALYAEVERQHRNAA